MSHSFIDRNNNNYDTRNNETGQAQKKIDPAAQLKDLNDDRVRDWGLFDNYPAQMFAKEEDLTAEAKAKEEDEKVQAKKGGDELQKKAIPENEKKQSGSSGTKTNLPNDVRGKMESSFGTDFSGVNIHQNSGKASNIGALAYTQGSDVHFAPGQYNPGSQKGQELIGHELTHVVQQRQGRVKPTKQGKGMPINDNPSLEKEADEMGAKASSGLKASPIKQAGNSVQCSNTPWMDMLNDKQRSGLVAFIPELLDLTKEQKVNAINVWSGNADIEDFMPGSFALELVLTIVGAGIGGALGGMLGNTLSKIAGEITTGAATDAIKKLYEVGYDKLKGILTAPSEDLSQNVSDGLSGQVKTGLKNYYAETMRQMFGSEQYASLDRFTNELSGMSDEELAILAYSLDSIYKDLKSNAEPLLQQITIGYIKLQDVLYIQRESGIEGDLNSEENREKLEEFYRQDDTIVETEKRSGQILVTGPVSTTIGDYNSPSPRIGNAIVTKLNEATYSHLKGVKIQDLPFSVGFRFWGNTPNHNYLNIFDSALCKVWFVKDTFGSIWIDGNESWENDSNGYDQGREWLARHELSTDKELTNDEIKTNAPKGARKLYNSIKDKTLDSVIDLDLFK